LTLAPISVLELRFFLPPTQQQLASRVRASPPSIRLFRTTTPDLQRPDSETGTCSKSKPTQGLQNTSVDSLRELIQFCANLLLRKRPRQVPRVSPRVRGSHPVCL
jgi:hypothetical protein